MRYFIQLSYNGTNYHGWQSQPNAITVQETLENALSVIFNSKVELMGAGRTDTGVHAQQMFAHFDFDPEIDVQNTIHKLNSYLPNTIAIVNIHDVHDTAHARFDAKKRTYQYHINTTKNVFLEEKSWYYHQALDVSLMNEAAKILMLHNDFQCFSKVHTDVNTFNCKITEAFWKEADEKLIFTISADRFLRNMVRAIVGTLVYVGLKKITLTDFNAIIESKDRGKAGFSVPAHGLYLINIEYDYLKLTNK